MLLLLSLLSLKSGPFISAQHELFAYLIRDAVSQRRVFHFSAFISYGNSVNDDSAM